MDTIKVIAENKKEHQIAFDKDSIGMCRKLTNVLFM